MITVSKVTGWTWRVGAICYIVKIKKLFALSFGLAYTSFIESTDRKNEMQTIEQQIKALGCGIYAVKLNNSGRLRDAVVSVPEKIGTVIRMQVVYQKDNFTWVKTYKVKGNQIAEVSLAIANELLIETWGVLVQFPKGQIEVQ